MENKYLELFIKTCGSEKKSGEILKLTQQAISSMRCGRTKIHFKKAQSIADYLRIKSGLDISPEEIISPIEKRKRELSHSTLFYELPIQFSSINLELVKTIAFENYYHIDKKIDSERLIIIDEFYYLISDEETYFYYLNSNKKIVKGCKINLQKLVNRSLNKSIITYIFEKFDLIERTKFAQRVESLCSNRRGKLSKKCSKVENSPHLVLPEGVKTREYVAQLFSIGSDHTYRTLKKIIAHNDKTLIEQVRREKITPHAAYQQILNTEPKFSFSLCSLFNR